MARSSLIVQLSKFQSQIQKQIETGGIVKRAPACKLTNIDRLVRTLQSKRYNQA